MKLTRVLTQIALLAAALASGSASALVLLDTSSAVTAANDQPQQGRLSRNGLQQDWAGGEAFPGIINPTVQYFYTTFAINVGNAPFIQIEFDSTSRNTFVSAYQGFYAPNSSPTGNRGFDNRWLGDAGTSGNFFGTDPLFFNVVAIPNQFLIVVVNTTAAGGVGLGDPFRLIVEGYADRDFNDPVAFRIPEPSTLLLLAPLALLAGLTTRRRRASIQARA